MATWYAKDANKDDELVAKMMGGTPRKKARPKKKKTQLPPLGGRSSVGRMSSRKGR